MRRGLVIGGLVLAAAVAAFIWYAGRPPATTQYQGYAEADYVKVGPVQQGLLTALHVGRGDEVAPGTLLFEQDETADHAARDEAARQLHQTREQLANLEAAGKPTEINQAEANLAEAQATLARAKADLDRGEQLLHMGGISAEALDQRRADFRSATARVAATQAALAQARAPMGREREIAAQHAAVEAAQAALDAAEWRLSQRRVTAAVNARVADVLAQPGETMAAGAPVVSLLPPKNIFVRFFIPEPDLARVHFGDAVTLICDSCPADLTGTVSFVSPQSEYSPPVIYSNESRAKLVYMIEARPPADRATLLHPGQPVTVRPTAKQDAP
ncbi:MAG: HlyD family efflux transporter periplasmic adaptor subunit [Alphaproteobacteria bacterium]|nr:HlyD family efflux transporter periplasmic adaptor subunit [Alphaproteobacteria bacterium]